MKGLPLTKRPCRLILCYIAMIEIQGKLNRLLRLESVRKDLVNGTELIKYALNDIAACQDDKNDFSTIIQKWCKLVNDEKEKLCRELLKTDLNEAGCRLENHVKKEKTYE